MTCQNYVCEIGLGQLLLVVILVSFGISVALFGIAEDVAEWWRKRHE